VGGGKKQVKKNGEKRERAKREGRREKEERRVRERKERGKDREKKITCLMFEPRLLLGSVFLVQEVPMPLFPHLLLAVEFPFHLEEKPLGPH
jgi:hypothetical protein